MEKEQVVKYIKKNWLLILIIVIGFAVRAYEFGDVPAGLHQDEVGAGYDAWAVYKYGIDSNGWHYPLIFQEYGPGQNALHQYLSIPFIALFGLNAFGIRFVDLVFGFIALIVFYLLVREISDKQTALIAVFLLAICPWHIILSRWGLEENLFPVFFLIGVYFMVRSIKQEYNLPVSFLFLALSLYSHNSAYFVVPLFVLLSSIYLLVHKKVRLKVFLLSAGIFCIVALPVFLYIIINLFDLSAIDTQFFSIPKVNMPRFKTNTLFTNNILGGIKNNFWDLMKLLISQDDGLLFDQIQPYGFLYPLSIPFFAIGFLVLLVRNFRIKVFEKSFFVLLWLLVSFALGLIVRAYGHRHNIIFFPLFFLTAVGIIHVKNKISPYLFYPIIVLYVLLFALFTHTYFTEYQERIGIVFFDGFGDAIHYATNATSGSICITSQPLMPHAYVLFYNQINPEIFIKTREYYNKDIQFRSVKKFDRYYFGGTSCQNATNPQAYVFHESEAKIFSTDKFTITRFKKYGVAVI